MWQTGNDNLASARPLANRNWILSELRRAIQAAIKKQRSRTRGSGRRKQVSKSLQVITWLCICHFLYGSQSPAFHILKKFQTLKKYFYKYCSQKTLFTEGQQDWNIKIFSNMLKNKKTSLNAVTAVFIGNNCLCISET